MITVGLETAPARLRQLRVVSDQRLYFVNGYVKNSDVAMPRTRRGIGASSRKTSDCVGIAASANRIRSHLRSGQRQRASGAPGFDQIGWRRENAKGA